MESLTVTADLSIDDLHEELGKQGIMEADSEDVPYFYLAALALECREQDDYDVNRVLMEFIRNTSELDVSTEAADEIEDLLR